MELLQLTYFCHAAQTQNFSHTAKQFNVPPSNISQSIKRLEEELGVQLFDRKTNRVTLNSRGEAFYREVSSALALIRHAGEAARGGGEDDVLRLGVHISRRVVMQTVAAFQSRYPNVNIVAEHTDHTQSGEFDLVVSDGAFSHPDFIRGRSFRERVVLAAKKGVLTPREELCVADIMDKPFITMSANYSMHNLTLEICRTLGFEPRIALQSEDPEYIRRCVELGLGVCLMPELSWRGLFSDEVEFHSLGEQSRDICIYSRRTPGASNYVEQFNHMLVEEFEREAAQT